MRAQLEAADARMVEENEQPCCYAKSDKYWVTDPTGIAWETFHTLGSIPVYGRRYGGLRPWCVDRTDREFRVPMLRAGAEGSARGKLLRQMTTDRIYNVLFLCTGNSARSILAESLLNHWGNGKFRAFSAGSFPKGQVHPLALDLLKRMNLPAEGLRSKSWDEFAAPGAPPIDLIFTVCDNAAGEVCPVWPGKPMTAHWGIADPAAVEGTDTREGIRLPEGTQRAGNPHQTLDESSDRLARSDDAAGQAA